MRSLLVVLTLTLTLGMAPSAQALLISTTSSAAAGGLGWKSGDVADLDAGAVVLIGRALFDATENVDAFTRAGSRWVLSTSTGATVQGTPYRDGDLLAWDPVSGTASLWLSEDLFEVDEDIDAVHVFADGRIALSTTSSATLGGLRFASGDVVVYDSVSDTASLLFDGSAWFDGTENVDAVAFDATGALLLSTGTDGTAGGLAFRDGDVLRFDGAAFAPFLGEDLFGGAQEDIDALHLARLVPAPTTIALLAFGLGALLRMPWARRRACPLAVLNPGRRGGA